MRTADLIDQLSRSARPVPHQAAARRLSLGAACGGVVAILPLAAWLGVRPDLATAVFVPAFWIKWAFTLGLAAAAFVVVLRLARPDGLAGKAWWGLFAPVALVGLMALAELVGAPPGSREGLIFGQTAARCMISVAGLSVPAFVGLIWAFRRLAPTQLRLAGAAAGLLAGAVGASVYVLTCPEHTPVFMVIWYDAGIALAGLGGATLGPRLLKW